MQPQTKPSNTQTISKTQQKLQDPDKSLWGKKVYLVFKCVHLQGGMDPQYQFKKAFLKQPQAKAYKQTLVGLFKKLDQVVTLTLDKNQQGYLKWVQYYQRWGDQFMRMCVDYKQIYNSIYSIKVVAPPKVQNSTKNTTANTVKNVTKPAVTKPIVTTNTKIQPQKPVVGTTVTKPASTVVKPKVQTTKPTISKVIPTKK